VRRIIALAIAGAVQLLGASGPAGAAQSGIAIADLRARLAGTWKAAEDRTPRTTDLDAQVFGPGAVSVRTVTLTLQPSGEGRMQVRTSVVGHNGRVYAPALLDVAFRLDDPVTIAPNRIQPAVALRSATTRDLDDAASQWNVEGARVSVILNDLESRRMFVEFETRDGRDAFTALLTPRS
jgi:hypothetical protein